MLRQHLHDKEFFYAEDSYEATIACQDMSPPHPLLDNSDDQFAQDIDEGILSFEGEELPF